MSGRWVYKPTAHVCNPPWWHRAADGAIWQCDCGQQWRWWSTWYGKGRWRVFPPPPLVPLPVSIHRS